MYVPWSRSLQRARNSTKGRYTSSNAAFHHQGEPDQRPFHIFLGPYLWPSLLRLLRYPHPAGPEGHLLLNVHNRTTRHNSYRLVQARLRTVFVAFLELLTPGQIATRVVSRILCMPRTVRQILTGEDATRQTMIEIRKAH